MTEFNSLGLRLGFTTNKDIELMIPIFLGWKILLKLVLNIVQYSSQESNVRQIEKNWYFCLPVARRVLRIWHLTVFSLFFNWTKNDFGSLTRTKKKQIKQWHSGSFWDIKMLWNLHILYMYLLNIRVRRFSLTLY